MTIKLFLRICQIYSMNLGLEIMLANQELQLLEILATPGLF